MSWTFACLLFMGGREQFLSDLVPKGLVQHALQDSNDVSGRGKKMSEILNVTENAVRERAKTVAFSIMLLCHIDLPNCKLHSFLNWFSKKGHTFHWEESTQVRNMCSSIFDLVVICCTNGNCLYSLS